MSSTNAQIYLEFVEQVINDKRFDLLENYVSQECVSHNPPYVGVGCNIDYTSGKTIVINDVAPGGPAEGLLQVGDELVRASDDTGTWISFDQLKSGLWGQGKLGTKVALTVRRAGQLVEIPFIRGRVESRVVPLSIFLEGWRRFLLEEMPDLQTEINLLIEEGDMVASHETNTGVSTEYGQSAVWTEMMFSRFKDGKIVEMWGVEDLMSQMRQLGFRIQEPAKVKT